MEITEVKVYPAKETVDLKAYATVSLIIALLSEI